MLVHLGRVGLRVRKTVRVDLEVILALVAEQLRHYRGLIGLLRVEVPLRLRL